MKPSTARQAAIAAHRFGLGEPDQAPIGNDPRSWLQAPAAITQRPFAERLALFWANHFTVSVGKGSTQGLAGCFEREAIRPHIAGRFADLLYDTQGTDHGSSGAALVLGGAVRGGRVLTDWPGLAMAQRHEGRDLRVTTDLRAIFRTVLIDHLGLPAARVGQQILSGTAALAPLPLLRG